MQTLFCKLSQRQKKVISTHSEDLRNARYTQSAFTLIAAASKSTSFCTGVTEMQSVKKAAWFLLLFLAHFFLTALTFTACPRTIYCTRHAGNLREVYSSSRNSFERSCTPTDLSPTQMILRCQGSGKKYPASSHTTEQASFSQRWRRQLHCAGRGAFEHAFMGVIITSVMKRE